MIAVHTIPYLPFSFGEQARSVCFPVQNNQFFLLAGGWSNRQGPAFPRLMLYMSQDILANILKQLCYVN